MALAHQPRWLPLPGLLLQGLLLSGLLAAPVFQSGAVVVYFGDAQGTFATAAPRQLAQFGGGLESVDHFGLALCAGDFDGNGVSDFTVYRPSNGTWYMLDPSTQTFSAFNFGIAEDVPIPADYDGDSKADIAVFRPSTSVWYRLNSTNGGFYARLFGQTGDIPSPSSVQP